MDNLEIKLLNYDLYYMHFYDIDRKTYDNSDNARVTEFAALLGACTNSYGHCSWWCQTRGFVNDPHTFIQIEAINKSGAATTLDSDDSGAAIRPAVKFSEIEKYVNYDLPTDLDTFSFEFGEYPQSIVRDENLSSKLDKLYEDKEIKLTGKTYTIDNPFWKNEDESDCFIPHSLIEYTYEGRKFIRLNGIENFLRDINHRYVKVDLENLDYIWIEVEPIRWIADLTQNIAVTAKTLISGIQFQYKYFNDIKFNYFDFIDFKDTSMYKYLNTYFVKDMMPKQLYNNLNNYKSNSYNELIGKKFK